MKNEISLLLESYATNTDSEAIHALKEIIQELVLASLSKSDFFDKAAFYGGTALRIFHNLPRFSEDMVFTLLQPDPTFQMDKYFDVILEELTSYGFDIEAHSKKKRIVSPIQSAFLKGNTEYHLVKFLARERPIRGVPRNAVITIKLEIDIDPPAGAHVERRFRLQPSPYSVLLYDLPSLFAGKMHALLCRKWKQREKGRDFYDYVWYLQQGTEVNLFHVEQRMRQSGDWEKEDNLTKDDLIELLLVRFSQAHYDIIKDDISPFIRDQSSISLYSEEFFRSITKEYLSVTHS